MSDLSPADTIRTAIDLLREHAAAATAGRRSVVEIRDPGLLDFPTRVLAAETTATGSVVWVTVADTRPGDAEFIALFTRDAGLALADWLAAELRVHEQAGALAAAATSGEVHIGGSVARMEIGMSTLDKALAVATALTGAGVAK